MIGKRLQKLLGNNVEAGRGFTGSVQTAQKAEKDGLIVITSYLDEAYRPATPESKKYGACHYTLTETGNKLRLEISNQSVKVAGDKTDPQLQFLIEQTTKQTYEGHGEPEEDFDDTTRLIKLIELSQSWINNACTYLGLDFNRLQYTCYRSEQQQFGMILSSCGIEDSETAIELKFELIAAPSWRHYYPIYLEVSLNFRYNARYYIGRVLKEYPRILADVLNYGRCIEFETNMPVKNEPTHRANAFEWLVAYFADDDDEEEHFFLRTEAWSETTTQTIRQAVICLMALYDAATAAEGDERDNDRLLKHFQTISRRKKKRT